MRSKSPKAKLRSARQSGKQSKIRSADPEVAKLLEKAIRSKGFAQFRVMDNGGRPFSVRLTKQGDKLNVTLSNKDEQGFGQRMDIFSGFTLDLLDLDQVWVGSGSLNNVHDKSSPTFLGNTALIVKGQEAISVASGITKFDLDRNEKVTHYVSTVGNSGVPYGWIETNKNYYAISTFNCETGVVAKDRVNIKKLFNGVWSLACWDDDLLEKAKPIESLVVLVPRF